MNVLGLWRDSRNSELSAWMLKIAGDAFNGEDSATSLPVSGVMIRRKPISGISNNIIDRLHDWECLPHA